MKQHDEILTQDSATQLRKSYKDYLEEELAKSAQFTPVLTTLQGKWSNMVLPNGAQANYYPDTGVSVENLLEIGRASVRTPDGFVKFSRLKIIQY